MVTLCPIAIVASCRNCLAFAVCPLKGVIGDQQEEDTPEPGAQPHQPRARPGEDTD